MSNSIGDLKNSGLQGNNFPWQLKMLEGLQLIYDEVKKPLTCAEDSINICTGGGALPVTIDCNDRISLCVDGNIVNAANALPVRVTNPLPLEVNINQANDSILIYGFDGTNNQPVSVGTNGYVNVNANVTFPASLSVTQNALSNPWTVAGTVALDTATLAALETITVNQGTSPWTISGTVALDAATLAALETITVNQGTSPWVVSGSVNIGTMPEVEIKNDVANPIPVNGTVAATQSGTWNIGSVTGPVALPTGAATETTLAAVNTKLTPTTRTHNTISATTGPTAIGSVPVGSLRGSVMNVGSAAGTWNGISIPAGVAIPWDAVGPRDTYGAIAYNATGTTLIIEYTT